MRRVHDGRQGHCTSRLIGLTVAIGLLVGIAPGASARVATANDVLVETPVYRLQALVWNEQQVRALTFTSGDGFVMKVATAFASFSGRRITSEIGTSAGARAAINGDFRISATDAPRHLTVIDGELWTTGVPNQRGWAFTTTADGGRAWIGRTVPAITATQGETSFAVVGWNAQQPKYRRVVAFTRRGGTSRYLSTRTCTALLSPVAHVRGPHRTYRVEEVRARPATCDLTPLELPSRGHENVLLAGKEVRRLVAGQEIHVEVDLGHFGKVRQAFAGLPLIVRHGENVGRNCYASCDPKHGPDRCFACRNPRTAVGIGHGCSDKDLATPCEVLMVTVDGRQDGWSEGVRFPGLGQLMLELGAHHAFNLDGGGSTTMWVRTPNEACQSATRVGCLVNRPAYELERPRNDAIVLVAA